ncbi:hypothetical protein [Alkalicoccus daliensis]|uniref:Uncharacterized protein n=1 Tax=Alkalicoccus daliensis TaxID=745820 RepID=A0A1H0CW03_9BACI|nr:hypothetical protein [Alkalicoccus daliensis]SDN62087.1 hypothetical protein SAMN04488053_102252 [Alkalicoccus daliensis]
MLKTMLAWILVYPFVTVLLIMLIDYLRGQPEEVLYYLPNYLGFVTAGIVIGFVMHQVQKTRGVAGSPKKQ